MKKKKIFEEWDILEKGLKFKYLFTYLQYDPVPFRTGQIEGSLRNDFLTLAQRHRVQVFVVHGEAQLLSEGLDVLGEGVTYSVTAHTTQWEGGNCTY